MSDSITRTDSYQSQNDTLCDCLARCAAGESNAFSELYTLTAPKFTAILMNMVRNEAECADIMQDAYLSIWKNADRFDPTKGKPFTWMLVIMRNRALDALRAKSRVPTLETLSEGGIETFEDEGETPQDVTRNRMLRRFLAPHISKLRPRVAKAVTLSIFEGHSFREIGETMSVPTNTAKSWVRRGLMKMRTDIQSVHSGVQLQDIL